MWLYLQYSIGNKYQKCLGFSSQKDETYNQIWHRFSFCQTVLFTPMFCISAKTLPQVLHSSIISLSYSHGLALRVSLLYLAEILWSTYKYDTVPLILQNQICSFNCFSLLSLPFLAVFSYLVHPLIGDGFLESLSFESLKELTNGCVPFLILQPRFHSHQLYHCFLLNSLYADSFHYHFLFLISVFHCLSSSHSSYSFEESFCLLKFVSNLCHKCHLVLFNSVSTSTVLTRRTCYAQNNGTKFFSSVSHSSAQASGD